MIKLILLILIILILSSCFINAFTYNRNENYDNYKLDENDRLYIKLQELVFNEDHIYKHDIDLFNKYGEFHKWKNVRVLDAGTGFGRHYNQLPDDIEKIGVDKEELYLERAEIKNPKGKFLLGKLEDYKLFEMESLTHILCTMDTIYNNRPDEEMKDIISNFKFWLKKDGILAIHIYNDTDNLDPMARDFSMIHEDEHRNKHSITYFNNFTHDAYFKKLEDNLFSYVEKYIVPSGNSINKSRNLHIIPKDKMIKLILDNNFELYQKVNLKTIGITDYSFYFFKKK